MGKKGIKKLVSDQTLRKLAENFIRESRKARRSGPLGKDEAFAREYRTSGQYTYIYGAELSDAEDEFIIAVTRKLGAKSGNEKQIQLTSWSLIDALLARAIDIGNEEISQFLTSIEADSTKEHISVFPCQSVCLNGYHKKLNLGPVSIISGAELVEEYRTKLHAKVGDSFGSQAGGWTVLEENWLVHHKIPRENAVEEGRWLIDIALTLIRFAKCVAEKGRVFGEYPGLNAIEADPVIRRTSFRYAFHITEINGGSSIGSGMRAWQRYTISNEAGNHINSRLFQSLCKSIYEADTNYVGSNMAKVLAWLSRARRAEDKAARMVFLSMAMEALVSSTDTKGPVLETIKRRISVILEDEPSGRKAVAEKIGQLYNLRSQLVHQGERRAITVDITTLHMIVQNAAFRILRDVDMQKPFKELLEEWDAASYGAKWPLTETNRVGIT
ncbi:MAG: HEPN domain-containing protein [Thalassospira sp.]|uniref:hypothetical protein n=1 Tax=Thalassospira sp. TaxID=1912094 RepID=UPI0032EAF95D